MTHIDIDAAAHTATPETHRRIPPPPARTTPPSQQHSSDADRTPPQAVSTTGRTAADHTPAPDTDDDPVSAEIVIRPWVDPVVDDSGHDPRSLYVERFWLGVLGPTATWLMRRLAAGLVSQPDGYVVDLAATARIMGLSYTAGRSSPFAKALQRCTMFGLAHQTSDGLAVRRRIPTVAHRHLRRMPDVLQLEHSEWEHTSISSDDLVRAHTLAVAMLDAGDALEEIEHQLVAIGVTEIVASHVTDNAARLERAASAMTE